MTTRETTSRLSVGFHELRLALRLMAKKPSFVIASVLMLGLGTGVNAALFGILHSVVFKPLAATYPDQLVTLSQKASGGVSIPDLEDFRAQAHSFQQIEAYLFSAFSFRDQSGTELLTGAQVTPGYLAMLGTPPLLGRTLDSPTQQSGQDHTVVLSEGLWKSRFAGDRNVIGTMINLNGEPYAVVGIMPQELRLPYDNTQLWVPVPSNSPWKQSRGIHGLRMLARLKPTASLQDAQAELTFLTNRLAELYPKDDGGRSVIVIGLHEAMVSYIRPKLYLLVFAVGFIFLIAAANVASLSMTRAADRSREVAIRKALGATRGRLVYQLVIENFLQAVLGSSIGWVLARWWIALIVALKPPRLPRLHDIHLDYTAFLLLVAFSFVTAVVLVAVNFLEFERVKLHDALSSGGRGMIGSRRQWLRNSLVGIEMATAVMLLIGAGLLIRSFQKIYLVDYGFVPEGRLSLHLSLSAQQHKAPAAPEIYQPLYEKLRSLPGVTNVGLANVLPLQGSFDTEYFVEDRTPQDSHNSAEARIVNENYLQAMGMVLMSGRQFTADDNEKNAHVVIVNQKLAKTWFPSQDPNGNRIRAFGSQDWMTIIGVVADMHDSTIETGAPVEFFLPYRQNPYPPAFWNVGVVVQTASAPSSMEHEIKQAIQSVNPEITLSGFETMEEVVGDSLRDRRLAMTLLAIFASLALILATYGIYALLAYSVRLRTRDIGVRMAMGADRGRILSHITLQGMRVVVPGLVLGTTGAYILSRLLEALLFGVSATDPLTFVLANLILISTALCAILLPAWRGAKLDPLDALRVE